MIVLMLNAAFATSWPSFDEPVQMKGYDASKDAALIVAIEDYAYVSDIEGAVKNGEDWYNFFTKSLNLNPLNVRELYDDEADKISIQAEAEYIGQKVGEGGRVWFVYIGHGAPSKDGTDGLLLPTGVKQTPNHIYGLGIPQSELLKTLMSDGASPIAIIDACFSGRDSSGAPIASIQLPQCVLVGG